MNDGSLSLAAWSYGLAGVAYAALALYLLCSDAWRLPGQRASRLLLAAVVASALWGWFGVADQFAATVLFIRLGAQADLLVYAAWFEFFLTLLRPHPNARAAAGSAGRL